MVYCGKPSKACAECRSRRTKCDAQRPSCGQCMRAHRNCWGYIDPISSMFRNENTKFKDIRHHTAAGTPLIHGPAWASTSYSISPHLSPSFDEQATCFFFQNYVLQDTCASRGHFDFLPTIYQNFKVNKVLEDAVVALGLAGLANKTKVSNVMVKATVKYDTTVRAVSIVLGEEEEAKSDQTLIAVMLLSLYEIITSGAPRSIRYWTQHIKGAISILRLRGEGQLHTEVGRRLFVQLRSQVITTCIHRRLAVPEEIHEWTRVSKQYETIQELSATHMAEIAMQICALRSSMEDFRDHSNAVSVVSQALEIDNAFSDWVTKLPTQYFYNTVTIFQRCEEVFSDHYHVYDGVCIATTWNSYRSLRIVLNEILIEQMIHLYQAQLTSPEPNTELIDFYRSRTRACQALVQQLTIDICASVPFYFSYHKNGDQTQVQVPAMSGNLLLWCLYGAAVAGNISDMMRIWIVGRLKAIYEVMGIRHALGLVEVLKEKREITVWETESETSSLDGDNESAEWFVSTREVIPPDHL